jgi:hypothetical protein
MSIRRAAIRRVSGAGRTLQAARGRLETPIARRPVMRVIVLIKANKDSEAGVMPSEQLLSEMNDFNEQLVKARHHAGGEGLHPSSKGARVRFSGQRAQGRSMVRSPRRRS